MSTTYTFPADIQRILDKLVESGRYGSLDEVVRDAVKLLDERETKRNELIAKLQVGIDQAARGESILWTPELRERTRESARRRAALGEQPNPDVCP